jgi:protein-S-isoprenylcysteine O-methyltransferase Ste14
MSESAEKHRWSLRDYLESIVLGVSILLEVVFAIVFFNYLGLTILVYCGFVLLGLSLVMGWLARVEFKNKGSVLEGKSYVNTTVLVKSGIYAVVRHPMYTSGIVLALALTMISQHWLSVVIGTMPMVIFYVGAWEEDKSLVDTFGEDYKIYMRKVPRVNVILGVLKSLLGRREN